MICHLLYSLQQLQLQAPVHLGMYLTPAACASQDLALCNCTNRGGVSINHDVGLASTSSSSSFCPAAEALHAPAACKQLSRVCSVSPKQQLRCVEAGNIAATRGSHRCLALKDSRTRAAAVADAAAADVVDMAYLQLGF